MDGEVSVMSEPGEGSRFTFAFAAPAADGALQAVDVATQEMHFAGVRVLLAEDNAVNILVAERHLKALGCSVVV
ncbi:hybrid sensor histidine kinase/response regulator, partial [Pseudomonas sp. FW306-02-F04-BA]